MVIVLLNATDNAEYYPLSVFLLPCSLRKWKYGDGKKIVFEIIADSDCTTLKT